MPGWCVDHLDWGFCRRGPGDGPASETWRLGQNTFCSRSLSSFALSWWSVDMVARFLLPRRVRRIEFLFHPWVGKIPWRRKWQPTLVFWPEKPHRQRSLGGYSPKGRKESLTRQLNTQTHTHTDTHTHTTGNGGRESGGPFMIPKDALDHPQTIRVLAISKYNQNRGLIHSSYSKKCPSFSGSEKSGLEMLNSHSSLCFQNWPVCPCQTDLRFPLTAHLSWTPQLSLDI